MSKSTGAQGLHMAGAQSPGKLLATSLDDRWRTFLRQIVRARRHPSEVAIHDLRVATRRLLATLSLLDSVLPGGRLRKARRQLRGHLKAFNNLRDVQVQLLRARALRRRFPQLRPFVADLVRSERRLMRVAGAEVRRIRCAPLERTMGEEVEKLLSLYAEEPMRRAGLATLHGAGASAFATVMLRFLELDYTDPRSIHRLRVAFKKFRYTLEIIRPMLGWIRKAHLKRMNAYQTAMGEIQDLEVLTSSVKSFARRQARVASLSFITVYQYLAEERRRVLEDFRGRAGAVRGFWR
jgi:CHAD domain-containing protein